MITVSKWLGLIKVYMTKIWNDHCLKMTRSDKSIFSDSQSCKAEKNILTHTLLCKDALWALYQSTTTLRGLLPRLLLSTLMHTLKKVTQTGSSQPIDMERAKVLCTISSFQSCSVEQKPLFKECGSQLTQIYTPADPVSVSMTSNDTTI